MSDYTTTNNNNNNNNSNNSNNSKNNKNNKNNNNNSIKNKKTLMILGSNKAIILCIILIVLRTYYTHFKFGCNEL